MVVLERTLASLPFSLGLERRKRVLYHLAASPSDSNQHVNYRMDY